MTDKSDTTGSLDKMAAEMAELKAEVEKLQRLLEEVKGERDYLRQALTAALATQQKLIEARPYFESPRRWWEFWKG